VLSNPSLRQPPLFHPHSFSPILSSVWALEGLSPFSLMPKILPIPFFLLLAVPLEPFFPFFYPSTTFYSKYHPVSEVVASCTA